MPTPSRTRSALAAGCLAALILVPAVPGQAAPRAGAADAPSAAWQTAAALEARCRPELEKLQEARGFPGAVFAFAYADGRSGAVSAGLADPGEERALTPDDWMLSGSIGKTYVSAVVLQLVEEDKLELDCRAADWLEEEDWFVRVPNAAELTLRQLLRHQSGIPEHVQLPEFWKAVREDPYKVWRPEELVAFVLDRKPLFPAGEGWSYADTNYILVGMILERAAGASYYGELRRRILEPMRLEQTRPSDSPELPGLCPGHPRLMAAAIGAPPTTLSEGRFFVNPQLEWTGGGLYCTTRDLARWGSLLYGGKAFGSESMAALLDGVPAHTAPGDRYGLGVQLWESELGPVYGHGGWFPGYLAELAYFPDHELAVAIQFNTDEIQRTGSPREHLVSLAKRLLAEE